VNGLDRVCRKHGEKRNAYTILVGNPEGRDCIEKFYVEGNLLLKYILKK
jgi:hypothetical protein